MIKHLSAPSYAPIPFRSAPGISSESSWRTFYQTIVVCGLTFLATTCGVHDSLHFLAKISFCRWPPALLTTTQTRVANDHRDISRLLYRVSEVPMVRLVDAPSNLFFHATQLHLTSPRC